MNHKPTAYELNELKFEALVDIPGSPREEGAVQSDGTTCVKGWSGVDGSTQV